ncbi:hypothetical protein PIB30_091800, partial [Stylosanthes scabra]|nr:hypothetical protein [Stylosanthes scabra]
MKANISDNTNTNNFDAVFVYGDPDPYKRRAQWEDMTISMGDINAPRLIIGDFNDILTQEEKEGLQPKPTAQ